MKRAITSTYRLQLRGPHADPDGREFGFAQAADIVPIAVISLLLAFVATIYPSWRASRVNPAEALRYE